MNKIAKNEQITLRMATDWETECARLECKFAPDVVLAADDAFAGKTALYRGIVNENGEYDSGMEDTVSRRLTMVKMQDRVLYCPVCDGFTGKLADCSVIREYGEDIVVCPNCGSDYLPGLDDYFENDLPRRKFRNRRK